MSLYELTVKEKGRTLFPVSLQNECGFKPGDVLIVHEVEPGRFTVETRDSVLKRVWAITAAEAPEQDSFDYSHVHSDELALEEDRLIRMLDTSHNSEAESQRRGEILLKTMLEQN